MSKRVAVSWKPANQSSRLPQWIPSRFHGLLRWTIKWAFIGGSIFVAIAIFYFYLALKFDLSEVAKIPERSTVLDRHGETYGLIHGERRRVITRDELPDVMVQALRAREDLRFYDHSGVDIKGLARATLRNIKDWSFTQGASTLTMQLARNSYDDMSAKSLHRKFLEIALTLRIEGRYSKDEILANYLNRIYFGSGCHGVEEAAQTYFGRPVSELNTGESAMLIGIIRGPHIFSPLRNMKGAKAQRDEVLERMEVCGFLTDEEKENAMGEPIRLVSAESRHQNSSYAREAIRVKLQRILDEHDIRSGGLKIYTTLDSKIQKQSEKVLREPFSEIEDTDGLQASAVTIDPKTGGILALCGGRDYKTSPYNRAYLSKRDLGPAYTPFLEASALERSKVVIAGKPVQTGRQLGFGETIRLTKRLGLSGPYQKTEDLYRGAIAASPLELASAASILVNQGESLEAHLITKIEDAKGKVVYQFSPSPNQAISKAAAKEVMKGIKSNNGTLISCTGSRRDGWAISLKKNAATVIWIGYDKPKRIADSEPLKKSLKNLVSKVTLGR